MMGSLSSPPHSAVAMAKHLVAQAELGPKPLGSLRLLLSPIAGQEPELPAGWSPPRASFQKILETAAAWKAASDRPDDRLICYYCGHGLRADPVLLPEDFGSGVGPMMLRGISFQKSRSGLASAKPREQLWFIDACRNEAMPALTDAPLGMFDSVFDAADWVDLKSTGLLATKAFTQAFGAEGAPSFFCEALIEALRGGAAAKEMGTWSTRADRLLEAVSQYMRLDQHKPPTFIEGDADITLTELPEPPTVRVVVHADPRPNAGKSDLRAHSGGESVAFPKPVQRIWRGALSPGQWTLRAEPKDGAQPKAVETDALVVPPAAVEVLKWQA